MATDPASPDRMNFSKGGQPLVDAAFLSQALLQAPEVLWMPLQDAEKAQVITGLQHLGLPADDPFWTAPPKPWTQQRIWAGEDVKADHSHRE